MKIKNVYVVSDRHTTCEQLCKGIVKNNLIKILGSGGSIGAKQSITSLHVNYVIINIEKNNNSLKDLILELKKDVTIKIIALIDKEAFMPTYIMSCDVVYKNLELISESVIEQIIKKIVNDSHIKDTHFMHHQVTITNLTGVVAIGASTGGTEATLSILKELPRVMPGIVITQHMMPDFVPLYVNRLDKECEFDVKLASDGDIIRPGLILMAPGDKHMEVVKKNGKFCVKCYKGAKVSGHCPSVDVLFSSIAKAVGISAVGVILTGMGADGAKGLKEMRDNGAYTIGQSEGSCCVYGMPKVAFEMNAVKIQKSLELIPNEIISYLKKR